MRSSWLRKRKGAKKKKMGEIPERVFERVEEKLEEYGTTRWDPVRHIEVPVPKRTTALEIINIVLTAVRDGDLEA